MTSTKYRPDIQGLRAIAVVSVVLFHADHRILTGGFVGVDVFFVISGFLICGIILNGVEKGTFTIAGFYRRRICRIFPALYVMLAVSMLLGYKLLAPAGFRELARTTISTIFFISNFDFYKLSGYFDGQSELKPLLHTWSLAVEEQYYIFFPILAMVAWPRLRQRFWALILVLGLASLAASIWITAKDPSLAFFSAPTRAFELLIGAGLAAGLLPTIERQWVRDFASAAGLVTIVASFSLIDADAHFPGYIALAPCLGAALVIHAGRGGSSLGGRIIGSAPFRFFGDISYSLYLWHWPLLVFARHYFLNEMTGLETAAVVGLAVVIAHVSFRFVEGPFLADAGARLPVLRWGGGVMAFGSIVAAVVLTLHGLPTRFPQRALALFAGADDFNHERYRCHADGVHMIAYEKHCIFGDPNAAPDTVVWGDSQGAEIAKALGERLKSQHRSVMQITSSACPPALGFRTVDRPYCGAQNADTFAHLTEDRRIGVVVLSASLIGLPTDQWAALELGYRSAASGLVAAGKRVMLVDPFPQMKYDPPSALGLKLTRGEPFEDYGISRDIYDRASSRARDFLDSVAMETGADRIKTENILCDHVLCHAYLPTVGGLYFNEGHLSMAGSRLVVASFPPTSNGSEPATNR